jgi:hypothetical protein
MGKPSPLGVSLKKLCFQGKLFTSSFLQAAVPILGIDFLREFKVTVAPEINLIQFACTAAALPAPYLPSAAPPASPCLFSSPPVPAPVCTQTVLPQPSGSHFRPTGFFTFPSGAATRRFWNRFPTWQGGFCMPRTGGAITGATDVVPVPSTGTATEVGPLTSSPPGRGQSSGGALWTPAYTPGDGQTSWVYSTNPVLHLYISCYVTVNK